MSAPDSDWAAKAGDRPAVVSGTKCASWLPRPDRNRRLHATTVYDYVRRTMPYLVPQSLTPDETYAVAAWLLFQNGIITDNAVIDARTLPAVQMPNRNGFVPDPRPDVRGW